MNVNVWDVVEPIKALVTSGVAIDAGRLADDSTDAGRIAQAIDAVALRQA